MENSLNTIKELTHDLIIRLGFEGEVTIFLEKNVIKVRVETPEAILLIGRGGETLLSVRHVLKLLIHKTVDQPFILDFDINNYREEKVTLLKEIARTLAERVISSQDALTLKPMPAADRRVIHMELQSIEGLETESVGEEPERRLVIRPVAQDITRTISTQNVEVPEELSSV